MRLIKSQTMGELEERLELFGLCFSAKYSHQRVQTAWQQLMGAVDMTDEEMEGLRLLDEKEETPTKPFYRKFNTLQDAYDLNIT